MLSAVLETFRPKARRENSVREFVAAANAGDYDAAGELLTDDFVIADVNGSEVSGKDDFIREDRRFRNAAGQPLLVLESIDHNRGEVLVRGHMEGGVEDVSGPTMWRVGFRGDKIAHVEVTRAMSNVTMPAYASRGALLNC